eukprot:2561633-Rhodomonas_salina.2
MARVRAVHALRAAAAGHAPPHAAPAIGQAQPGVAGPRQEAAAQRQTLRLRPRARVPAQPLRLLSLLPVPQRNLAAVARQVPAPSRQPAGPAAGAAPPHRWTHATPEQTPYINLTPRNCPKQWH